MTDLTINARPTVRLCRNASRTLCFMELPVTIFDISLQGKNIFQPNESFTDVKVEREPREKYEPNKPRRLS